MLLCSEDISDESDTWASDWHDVRIMVDPVDKSEHLERDGVHLGVYTDVMKYHKLSDCTVVRARAGAEPTRLPCAVFRHPHVGGHMWFKTDDLYRIFKLQANAKPGVWFQKKT